VDAVTGELIWRLIGDRSLDDGTSATLFDPMMTFAVPSGLSAIDRNTDGMVDRLYFGDAGGQLWRIDMASGDRATWQTRRLLTLDQGQTFFTTPDVVTDPSGSYDGIILGTGDLAQLSDSSVPDYLILYRDRDPVSPSKMPLPLSLGDLYRLVNSAG
jgi:type IV pilus assembly protein PilY1